MLIKKDAAVLIKTNPWGYLSDGPYLAFSYIGYIGQIVWILGLFDRGLSVE